jgi:hypothetical protein
MDGVHTRTLQRALESLGTKERLAAALEISVPELQIYLNGEKPLAPGQLIAALEIVATNGSNHRA